VLNSNKPKNNCSLRANSYDEWSQLEEIIVGHASGYDSHDIDSTFRLFYLDNVRPPADCKEINIPQQLLNELEEDLDELVSALRGVGVTVLRPAPMDTRKQFASPLWVSKETPPLNVRDQAIILGNTILETAPHQRARYFENDYLKPIFYKYFESGSPWLSMPRPTLGKRSLDPSFFPSHEVDINFDDAHHIEGLGYELIFDGAQCIRLGNDVLVNVANQNHNLGLQWLSRHFEGSFRFWNLNCAADSHIDSLIVPLRPGLLLLRTPDILPHLPPQMQDWDILYAPEVSEDNFPDYSEFGFNLASKYIDTNVLSVNESTVVVNSLYPELCALLEAKGFDVLRVRHRHRRLFNGGFHCFTLDTIRKGSAEDYF